MGCRWGVKERGGGGQWAVAVVSLQSGWSIIESSLKNLFSLLWSNICPEHRSAKHTLTVIQNSTLEEKWSRLVASVRGTLWPSGWSSCLLAEARSLWIIEREKKSEEKCHQMSGRESCKNPGEILVNVGEELQETEPSQAPYGRTDKRTNDCSYSHSTHSSSRHWGRGAPLFGASRD